MRESLISASILVIAFLTSQSNRATRTTYGQNRTVAYYVDPDFRGISGGSAQAPWKTLDQSAWPIINAKLDSSDVTVYCSARNAGSDTEQVYGATGEIDLNNRTNTSGSMLTFDGRSVFNADDANPRWQS